MRLPILILFLFACQAVLASDWAMQLKKDATVVILHKGEPVAEAQHVAWEENWAWASPQARLGKDGTTFSGQVSKLGLNWQGKVVRTAEDSLEFQYDFDAKTTRRFVMGYGIEFQIKLGAASLGDRVSQPQILPNGRGWKWAVDEGKEVLVTGSAPFSRVYFDRNQKHKPRTMFYSGTLAEGKRQFSLRISVPGTTRRPIPEREAPAKRRKPKQWYLDALSGESSPVDLRFLNAGDMPAGQHGFVSADGERLVFADGTPARFWGTNIAAAAIFVPKETIEQHAERIARLGYNLVRFHHLDSNRWVRRPLIKTTDSGTGEFDPEVLDRFDYWVKCLRDAGVYVWLDLHEGRHLTAGDGIADGWDEMLAHSKSPQVGAGIKGYSYYNPKVQDLMLEFSQQLLSHVNPYTKLAYKDDPALVATLLSNENDLTQHFGNLMLADKNNPVHHERFREAVAAFAKSSGLKAEDCMRTWEPGAGKLFLNHHEYTVNRDMLSRLREGGVKVPLVSTNFWGGMGLLSLPALTAGDIIDAHTYGTAEALSANPRKEANLLAWASSAHIYGKPLTVSEWNSPYPNKDRFVTPLYVMSVASLQGWAAAMIYNYSQVPFTGQTVPDRWSTWNDPAITGLMPAAAIAFRQGHVAEARKTFCYLPDRDQLFYQRSSPASAAAIRTLTEQSKFRIAFPGYKELPWVQSTTLPDGIEIIDDINQDFIPKGRVVTSDTGELKRHWKRGWQTVDSARTQLAQGWIGGKARKLSNVEFDIETRKATVVVTSLDGAAIGESKRILISAIARASSRTDGTPGFLSEPVIGTLRIQNTIEGLQLFPLASDGREKRAVGMARKEGAYTLYLPSGKGTHWYMLRLPN